MHEFITKFAKCNKDDKDYLESVFRNNEIASYTTADDAYYENLFKARQEYLDEKEYTFSENEQFRDVYDEISNASIECMAENLMRDKGFVKDVFNGSCNFEDVVEYCYSNYDVDVQYPYKFVG